MKTLIKNAIIVNEGEVFKGSIVINGNRIAEVLHEGETPRRCDRIEIDAEGMYLIPGVIDDHVHFREPGLTHKATIHSESRAAAAGGITSYMEMPNTNPQTTTLKALKEKFSIAARDSAVNYSFYFGATTGNSKLFARLNPRQVCGIKLFMGSSTGNMLVDKAEALDEIFATAPLPIAVHCEDTSIISRNTKELMQSEGSDPDVRFHPIIRSSEACYLSTKSAVEYAQKHNAKLHVMHVSTERELELLISAQSSNKNITAEVTPAHLTFCDKDYAELGTRIKCNPAIKSEQDRNALRRALTENKIDVIGTDHAPHLLSDKSGGALRAASGMPSIQFSLVSMLQLVNEGVLSIETLVEKMCHAPAEIYSINNRGYLRKGYSADFVLLSPDAKQTVTKEDIVSLCGWSPFEGRTFDWGVRQTWVNGCCVYKDGVFDDTVRGKALRFNR